MLPAENVHRYLKALYPLGLLLTLVPILDWAAKSYPFHPSLLQWRFGALVSLIPILGIVLTGFALLGAIAAFCGQRPVMRALAGVAALGAALALVVLVLFVLDVTQMRGSVTEEAMRLGMTKALISGSATALMSTVALGSMALGLWRAAADARGARRSAEGMVIRGRPAASVQAHESL